MGRAVQAVSEVASSYGGNTMKIGETSDVNLSSEGTLVCPSCGTDYLHHYHVTSYRREVDEGPVIHRNLGKLRFNGERQEGCPSSRRGAVGVRLHCENCDDIHELCIVQHKGRTIIEIRRIHGSTAPSVNP